MPKLPPLPAPSWPWPRELQLRAVELYQRGHTLVEVAALLGYPTCGWAVSRSLHLHGVPARRRTKRERNLPQDKSDACVRMASEGMSLRQIAETLQVGIPLVTKTLKQRGVTTGYLWTEEDVHNLLELYAAGNTVAECARLMRSSRGVVRRHLRRCEVPVRDVVLRGAQHGAYKERTVNADGYVVIWVGDQKVLEHRYVMSLMVDRDLLPSEVVHHKNKNKQDNSPDNLQLFSSNAEHLAFELKGQTPKWTEAGKARIAAGIDKAARLKRKSHRSRTDDPR